MKKLLMPFILLLVLIISACGNQSTEKKDSSMSKENTSDTITYQSENGPIKVPAHPQRVVVLSSFAGNVMSLGVNLLG